MDQPAHTTAEQRFAPSFSLKNKMIRLLWGMTWFALARLSPPPLWAWRRMLLRLFGAQVGENARVYGSARIWLPSNLTLGDDAMLGRNVHCYNQGAITIGRHVTVSWNATLCSSTHNIENPAFPLYVRPIVIDDEAWIAAEAFVGPGVTVGKGAVLGARGVAMRNLDPWGYYSGNPASLVKPRPVLERGGR
jgi:putative colanic acid biosynthesis acetyltransferase WcaF